MAPLRVSNFNLEMSSPSIKIEPECNSTILVNAIEIVDLPAPVLPTIPTFSPGDTLNESFFKTVSINSLKENILLTTERNF